MDGCGNWLLLDIGGGGCCARQAAVVVVVVLGIDPRGKGMFALT